MIEQGLVILISASPAVASICTQGGGFMDQLPKGWDETVPSWTWTSVSRVPDYGLQYQPGLTRWMVQIDCYGLGATNSQGVSPQGADCIALAYAINSVLSGFNGVLADPQTTGVDSIFNTDWKTYYDEAGRTYRVLLEYRVNYFWS
jgi:hypothetical protein